MTQEILELLKEKKKIQLRRLMEDENPADIAATIEEMMDDDDISIEELLLLYRILPKEIAADTFVEMSFDTQEVLISAFSDKELREVLDDIFLDDTVDIIEEMPANVVKRILKNVDAATRASINQLLNYPEDSAGSLMTIEYVDLKKTMTVEESFGRIRKTGVDKETIYTCYVTDRNRKLLGTVSVKDLLLHPYETVVGDIMEENVICVNTHDDQEEVAQMFQKYGLLALPVVDKEDRLVGIITIDDAMDVLQEEHNEDVDLMAGIVPTDEPYLRLRVWDVYKARIPWLLLMMFSATFTSIILQRFESALAAQIALVAFIPMLMGTGGNSGSQASATIIRGISLNEIELSDFPRVLWKEIRVAVMCGITLSALMFLKVVFFDGETVGVALTVSLTLVCTILLAKAVGCGLPILSKRLGMDPAVMASPLITTVVDVFSLVVYFAIATAVLGL